MEVFSQVKQHKQGLVSAALQLKLSYRQIKRIWKRYREQGDAGLVHSSRGQRSNRARPQPEPEQVLALYAKKYPDFGPVLASEHLAQTDQIEIDHETLRRWLIAGGLWTAHLQRAKHRRDRERRACCGELVQIDGSDHDWLEGRGSHVVLMVMIDDASNETTARFYEAEETASVFDLFERYARRYGLPCTLYPDRDSIYCCTREARVDEELQGLGTETQFARAMRELGVGIILAYSPEAKGRVERRHQLFQDRLVKEMRLRGICTMDEAHAYLDQTFLPELNRRFTVPPRNAHDAHRRCPSRATLDATLCWKETRTVAKDWTLRWKNLRFQIPERHAGLRLAGQKIEVCEGRDGRRWATYRGKTITLEAAPAPMPATRPPVRTIPPSAKSRVRPRAKPAPDHPWRRGLRCANRASPTSLKTHSRSAVSAAQSPSCRTGISRIKKGTFLTS